MIAKHGGLRGYYKGTSLQAPVEPANELRFLQLIHEGAQQSLKDLLRDYPLARVKDMVIGTLDQLEQRLCETEKDGSVRMTDGEDQDNWIKQAFTGILSCDRQAEGLMHWFTFIAMALKLRLIEDDNLNGWEKCGPGPNICVLYK